MMTLLGDLIDFPFQEQFAHEKMLSLKTLSSVFVDGSQSQIENKGESFCYIRESLYGRIDAASGRLPSGYRFLVKEAFRPAGIQEASFRDVCRAYAKKYPGKNEHEIRVEASKFVAPVTVGGHPTGGAVDITLVRDGKEVDMGTAYNAEPGNTENRTYTLAENIGPNARASREILCAAMGEAGFINYPTEWWHWSWGDKYWAFVLNEKVQFSLIEDSEIPRMMAAP